jgi:hypothetical protein
MVMSVSVDKRVQCTGNTLYRSKVSDEVLVGDMSCIVDIPPTSEPVEL